MKTVLSRRRQPWHGVLSAPVLPRARRVEKRDDPPYECALVLRRLVGLAGGLVASVGGVLAVSFTACAADPVSPADPAPQPEIRLAAFDVDATPEVGSQLAYGPAIRPADLPLRCRGIVLLGAGEPIVLCCLDWIGIANEGHSVFCEALADAAGTRPDRVAVHVTHAHDAPYCDFTAERILRGLGIREASRFDGEFPRVVIARAAAAIRAALPAARPATHWGFDSAAVREVASNRRILGPDGTVRVTRFTACPDPAIRAEPEGVIDPLVTTLAFWNGDKPLAVLTAYACHPQSYYRQGVPSPDFPGIARFIRSQDLPMPLHIHFNGAGGNVGAGRYNDGSPTNRMKLAERLAAGMREAFAAIEKRPLRVADVGWSTTGVLLKPAAHLDEQTLTQQLREQGVGGSRVESLAWLARVRSGRPIRVSCLRIGTVRMLHLPGELFVEYQLAARSMRPDLDVMLLAYGDYGPFYIGTARAYGEGGYETAPTSSLVGLEAEQPLLDAMEKLLRDAAPGSDGALVD